MEILEDINSTFQPVFTQENFNLISNLKTKKIPLKETGIHPRIFNYWKKCGLILLENKIDKKRKWEMLSFVDFIWLKCIEEMRNFGIPFEKIKIAKERLFEEIESKEILAEYKKQIEEKKNNPIKDKISKLIQEINSYDMSSTEKEQIIASLQNTDIILESVSRRFNFNSFDLNILSTIMDKHDFGIFITKNNVIPFSFVNLTEDETKKLKEVILNSHVYISITNLYFQYLNDETKQRYFSEFPLLSKDEYAIHSFLKKENFREIKINRDSNCTIITGTMKFQYDSSQYRKWKKSTKLQYPFCEINEKQHDGKITSIEFKLKEIIKK